MKAWLQRNHVNNEDKKHLLLLVSTCVCVPQFTRLLQICFLVHVHAQVSIHVPVHVNVNEQVGEHGMGGGREKGRAYTC